MSLDIGITTPATTPVAGGTVNRLLLRCGATAGPLFVGVALAQVLTRDGFDIRRHPLSVLSLGELGWIQITTFIVAGLLYVAAAVGLRRCLPAGRGRTWGPILIGVFGVSLLWGGAFVADPIAGFPPGSGATPVAPTWHGIAHSMAPAVGFLALAAACFVFARRFAAEQRWRWVAYSVGAGLALFTPDPFYGRPWFTAVLAAAAAVGCAWASSVAAQFLGARYRRPLH
jgi:hypothetical protein